jgi:hypothetical protein
MPHLDLTKESDYIHLLQLYCAAHPNGQAIGDRLKTETRQDGTYVIPPAAPARLMRWALSKHLVTRKAAARYVEMCATLDKAIPDVVRPFVARLGDPPRAQLVIRGREIFQWLYLHSGGPDDDDGGRHEYVCTVQGALEILGSTAADTSEHEGTRARAAQLADWLREQPSLC